MKYNIFPAGERVKWISRAVAYSGTVEADHERSMYAFVRADNGKLYRVRKYRLTKLATQEPGQAPALSYDREQAIDADERQ